jgi:hypothetical protein
MRANSDAARSEPSDPGSESNEDVVASLHLGTEVILPAQRARCLLDHGLSLEVEHGAMVTFKCLTERL